MDIEPSKFCQLDAKDNQLSEINGSGFLEKVNFKAS